MAVKPKRNGPATTEPGNVFQRDAKSSIEGLSKTLILAGTPVTVDLTTTTTAVPHQLGRPYRGFIVIDKTATCDVWRDKTYTSQPATVIPLQASASVTVTLWVF